MLTSHLNVYGSADFFEKAPLKSSFFVVDTLFLLIATGIDVFVFARHDDTLVRIRLAVVLFGMWLLWWKAHAVHRQVRALGVPSPGDAVASYSREMMRITGSITHLGMLFTYVLNALLLMLAASALPK